MPFVLIAIAIILIASGYQGNQTQLFTMLKGDFTGKDNFFAWVIAIMIIGSVGYITPLKPVSRAFLILVILVLFLSNGGFFNKITTAFGFSGVSSTGFGSSVPSAVTPANTSLTSSNSIFNNFSMFPTSGS